MPVKVPDLMIDENFNFKPGDLLVIRKNLNDSQLTQLDSAVSHLLLLEIKFGTLFCITYFRSSDRAPLVLRWGEGEVMYLT